MALSGAYRLGYYTPEKIFHESSYTQRFKQLEALVNAQKLAFFAVAAAHWNRHRSNLAPPRRLPRPLRDLRARPISHHHRT